MTVYALQGDYLSELTYLVCEEGKALVIDPGTNAQRVLAACKRLSVTPIAVLLTHGHADHDLGAAGLQREGIKIYAHREEVHVISSKANLSIALGFGMEPFTPDVLVKDDDVLDLAPFTVKVIHTPGHTQGGVCYLLGGKLFTGDTLFPGSYGRTDFPTGDEQDLLCSIANVLFELPPETEVYAGHGFAPSSGAVCAPQTTIGEEYSTNPILNLL